MPEKILKSVASSFTPAFDVAVATYASEMKHWTGHMERVASDAKNPNIKPEDAHAPFPAPSAHPEVVRAVNAETFQPDFEIVDDGPTPAQILAYKKNDLFAIVSEAERVAIEAISPPGKRRYRSFIAKDISEGEMEVVRSLKADATNVDRDKAIAKSRTAKDRKFLDEQKDIDLKVEAVERAAAKLHHDIEDLTESNIDSWKMTPLV